MYNEESSSVYVASSHEAAHQRSSSSTTVLTVRAQNPSLYKHPESDACKRCHKFIYPLETMGPVMGNRYHKLCFRCNTCNRLLDFKTYRTNLIDLSDKSVYCSTHNPKNGKYAMDIRIG